ncbi:hypothetical protein [Nodularia sp. UHCC 0506]|uniref:hypothetical protein n=1 Tax=Nodularia sp. UHCC 0506 TaxID=3110243 RepID=UPI002B2128AA|nr:hypothetical protein [Nodularia sp. UHCC 0506]MEA5513353.1 hypothetical protein [Nodularia sp. UHCC 0506]
MIPIAAIKPLLTENPNYAAIAHAIVRCDEEATSYLLKELGGNELNFTIYPPRRIVIDIKVGED